MVGTKWTEERKQLMSKRNSGKGNPMYGIQLFGESNGNYGKVMKPHVKETLLKVRSKVTTDQVEEMRKLYATGNYTQTQLSRLFNLSVPQISRIVNGKRSGTIKAPQKK